MSNFTLAQPIYVKGLSRVMNAQAGFTCVVDAAEDKTYTLYLAGSTFFRVYLDGEVIHYGPARGPHGFIRCDTVPLPVKAGRSILAIEVAGYNCPSFYTMNLPSFLQAEVRADGECVYFTGRDFKAISLMGLREQKVIRYSYQRAFTEIWHLDAPEADWKRGEYEGAPIETVEHGQTYLEREFALPYMELAPDAHYVESGSYTLRHDPNHANNRFLHPGSDVVSFKTDEFVCDIIDETDADFKAETSIKKPLTAGKYSMYMRDHVYAGFVRAKLDVLEPATVYVVFAERIRNGRIDYGNGDCSWVNVVKYTLPAGKIQLESFEAYSLKYIGIMVASGKVTVESVGLREYTYPAKKIEVETDDPMLKAAMDAAYEAFRQNTVDCFMDCPGRERGGWLCDSYFTAQAAYLFTGSTECERVYLDNFRLPEKFPGLPLGLLPMCYPGDNLDKNTIPQWTMWYVLQVGAFAKRGGDPKPYREVLAKILAFLESYENADGLLEKLPYWNFVEWSRANKWVQDVNYPTNMLYHKILHVFADVLERPELLDKAAHVRDEIIRQAYDGKFFQDHAVRGEDGKLTLCGDYSAICQHEAALFDVIDINAPEWAEFRHNIVYGCGPDGDRSLLHDDMEPLDLFPGLMVRVELLHCLGMYEMNLSEISVMFGERMAAITGTLWEHCDARASMNHGISSAIAGVIVESLDALKK